MGCNIKGEYLIYLQKNFFIDLALWSNFIQIKEIIFLATTT